MLFSIIFGNMTIAERLRKLREERALSREAIAGAVGITSKSVENYESGIREPKTSDLIKIAKALSTTVAYLTGEVTDSDPEVFKKGNYRLRSNDGGIANSTEMEETQQKLRLEWMRAKEERLKLELDEIENKQKRRSNSTNDDKRSEGDGKIRK